MYTILGEEKATSAKVCEHLNACLPPRPAKNLKKKGSVMNRFEVFQKQGPHYRRRERNVENSIRIVQLADIHIEPEYAAVSGKVMLYFFIVVHT